MALDWQAMCLATVDANKVLTDRVRELELHLHATRDSLNNPQWMYYDPSARVRYLQAILRNIDGALAPMVLEDDVVADSYAGNPIGRAKAARLPRTNMVTEQGPAFCTDQDCVHIDGKCIKGMGR